MFGRVWKNISIFARKNMIRQEVVSGSALCKMGNLPLLLNQQQSIHIKKRTSDYETYTLIFLIRIHGC